MYFFERLTSSTFFLPSGSCVFAPTSLSPLPLSRFRPLCNGSDGLCCRSFVQPPHIKIIQPLMQHCGLLQNQAVIPVPLTNHRKRVHYPLPKLLTVHAVLHRRLIALHNPVRNLGIKFLVIHHSSSILIYIPGTLAQNFSVISETTSASSFQ